ncbi:MAG: hypothetical protein HOI08_01570 [Flavobacteriaceae bacterium]|jgi:hypothetical protein|nr:hypothetical protein [Flavobacteriaceae bacterium]
MKRKILLIAILIQVIGIIYGLINNVNEVTVPAIFFLILALTGFYEKPKP